jgi:hypothetical protein
MLRLSASSLKTYSKCGYKYKLQKIDGMTEPGPFSFGMLLGRIIDTAVKTISMTVWADKIRPNPDMIAEHFIQAYEYELRKADIPLDTVPYVKSLLLCSDPTAMATLWALSHSINSSASMGMPQFKLSVPPPLKSGGMPNNKSKPTLGQILEKAYLDLIWLFGHEGYLSLLLTATLVEPDKKIVSVIEEEGVEPFEVIVYLDQLIWVGDKPYIFEFKSDKTRYTDDFVTRMLQLITYRLAVDNSEVILADISHQNLIHKEVTPTMMELTRQRYVTMAKGIRADFFQPVCGTDPYSDKLMMCGFKACGSCAYASSSVEVDTEDE